MFRYDQRKLKLIAGFAVGESVLDIGCAQQPNPFLCARQVVGLDLKAMPVAPPYTEHLVGDATSPEAILRDRVFDTVVLGDVIEHMERPYDCLRAIRPHVSPQGRLILSTPNPLGLPVAMAEYLLLRRFFYTREHAFYFAPRWVWRMLERCGYRLVKTKGCGVSVLGPYLPVPTALSYEVIYVAMPAGP